MEIQLGLLYLADSKFLAHVVEPWWTVSIADFIKLKREKEMTVCSILSYAIKLSCQQWSFILLFHFFPTHWFCLLTMNSMYNNLFFDGPSFWYLWSYYDMENDTLAFNKVDAFLPNKIYYHGSLKSFLQITKWNGPEVHHIWFLVFGMFQ